MKVKPILGMVNSTKENHVTSTSMQSIKQVMSCNSALERHMGLPKLLFSVNRQLFPKFLLPSNNGYSLAQVSLHKCKLSVECVK